MMNALDIARRVFEIEAAALLHVQSKLGTAFEGALQCLLQCKGRVVFCGMGKSGLIGKKIAATFASIGRPAFFMHPSEAIHGDLGMLMAQDCFLSISNSGETDELLQLIPHIERLQLPHISLVGNPHSTLGKHADWVLDIGVREEASVLQAVPMASTLVTLAMGDALAAALIQLSDFRQEDFARFHPGGSLGRKILTKVADLMRRENLPLVQEDTALREVLMVMSKGMLGLAVVFAADGKLAGIVTDGDLRRALERSEEQHFFKLKAKDIMSVNPKTIQPEASVLAAEELMNQFKITALLVLNEGQFAGIIAKQFIR